MDLPLVNTTQYSKNIDRFLKIETTMVTKHGAGTVIARSPTAASCIWRQGAPGLLQSVLMDVLTSPSLKTVARERAAY